ncbi:MAG TPA: hypothetical protein VIH00_02560 [Candidatus Limnocylindrales bacterium]
MHPALVALFLVVHAAIHLSYLSPRPMATAAGPAWPFDLRRSWILSPLGAPDAATRALGLALVALTMAGFLLAASVVLGLAPSGLWLPAITIGAVASMGVLVLFFHPWLGVGVVVDVFLLFVVLAGGWSPDTTLFG